MGGSERAHPRYLVVGRVLGIWGTQGQLKVAATTDFPQRFSPGNNVYIQDQAFVIESSRDQGKFWVVKLAGVDDVEAARVLRWKELEVPGEAAFPLAPGQYYWFQVVGLQVYTAQGEHLGEIVEVLPNPANDSFLVQGAGKEFLIPAIEDVIVAVDLDAGRMTIEPLPGLL